MPCFGRLRLRQRQCEMKGCALPKFAFGPDAPTMGQDDVLDNGQTQACAARLA